MYGLQYLVWPLEHKYTNEGLRLAYLKGDDYYCACCVFQNCREHGGFYIVLANMRMQVTDLNNKDEKCEKDSQLYLTHIVDLEDFSLLIYLYLLIDETALLKKTFDRDRNPDIQWGGQYMGNQYSKINQLYNNNVSAQNNQMETTKVFGNML